MNISENSTDINSGSIHDDVIVIGYLVLILSLILFFIIPHVIFIRSLLDKYNYDREVR